MPFLPMFLVPSFLFSLGTDRGRKLNFSFLLLGVARVYTHIANDFLMSSFLLSPHAILLLRPYNRVIYLPLFWFEESWSECMI